jgi:hypothetical protein
MFPNVRFTTSVCPSVFGWLVLLKFKAVSNRLHSVLQKWERNLVSRSEVIDFGTPCNLTTSRRKKKKRLATWTASNVFLQVGLGTGQFKHVFTRLATRFVPIRLGQFQPSMNSKFSILFGYSSKTGWGFLAGWLSKVYALSANKSKGFFFPNNDICFFLVESRGQVFMYSRGKKMEEKDI